MQRPGFYGDNVISVEVRLRKNSQLGVANRLKSKKLFYLIYATLLNFVNRLLNLYKRLVNQARMKLK